MKITYLQSLPSSPRIGKRVLASEIEEGEFGKTQSYWFYKREGGVLYRIIPGDPHQGYNTWHESVFNTEPCITTRVMIVEDPSL